MKIELELLDNDLANIVRQYLVGSYALMYDDADMKKQAKVLRKTIKWYSTTSQWEEFKELYK